VDPVSVSVRIGRPREEVFAYLADIANHSEFSDHYLKDWRLTRIDTVGRGAGARFRMDIPFQRFAWADMTFVVVEPPHRIVAVGRGGKFNRIKTTAIWTLDVAPGGGTEVEYMVETEPELPTDRLMEAISRQHAWFKRKVSKAMRRLQAILEEDEDRGARVAVGGL
jgi:carbon monoxide dehydrogenase subunit G